MAYNEGKRGGRLMDYIKNTEAVIQNLKDVVCDEETATCFLKMTERGVGRDS